MEGSVTTEQEIRERLALIESMMREGRRSTEYWGWNFLLWGVAYLVAVAWASLPQMQGRALAWPVTMAGAALLTVTIARRRTRRLPKTERSRALQAMWTGIGLGICVFAFPVAFSGHYQTQSFVPAIEAMLGAAQVGSGMFLRWRTQVVIGMLWWAAAVASPFVSSNGAGYLFIAATLVCNIGFGVYLMALERRAGRTAVAVGEVRHG